MLGVLLKFCLMFLKKKNRLMDTHIFDIRVIINGMNAFGQNDREQNQGIVYIQF
jgi:hypothetical protein